MARRSQKTIAVQTLTWYHDNGKPRVTASVIKGTGICHGWYIEYDEQGNRQQEGEYAEGDRVGRWTVYWKPRRAGRPVRTRTVTYYSKGLIDGWQSHWTRQGELESETLYRHGEKLSESTPPRTSIK